MRTYQFKCSSDCTAVNVAVVEVAVVIRQLNKCRQRVVLQRQRALLSILRP